MRTLLILTSLMMIGCAHDTGIQVVGSIYCESDRPEGKAVAKVELRYTPPVDEPHNHSQAAAHAQCEAPKQANSDLSKESDTKPAATTPAVSKPETRDVPPKTLKNLAEELAATAAWQAVTECQK